MDSNRDTWHPAGATSPVRRHLRLVARATGPVPPPALQAVPTQRLRLCAWQPVPKPEVRTSAWVDLLGRMWPGEALHIVHRVSRPTSGAGSCSLHVDLCQSLSARSSQTPRMVDEALRSALPGLVFESVGLDQPDGALPLRATLSPLPAPLGVASHGPGGARGTWALLPPAAEGAVSFPALLPTWPLTVPYEEPLAESLEIRIRLRAQVLDEASRSLFVQLLHRLHGGSLHVLHPGATPASESFDPRLDQAMKDLLRQWLSRPVPGFTMDVQVGSKEDLSSYVLRRIGGDIFGAMPYRLLPADTEPAEPDAPPVLLRQSQGHGGLFPSVLHLAVLGVPRHLPVPGRLPQGPGSVLGHVGRNTPLLLPDAVRLSHTAVIGGSGTGKSTFMLRMLTEDIRRGLGAGLVDVHGDLFDAVLAAIPPERERDVVVIDAEDPAFSVALNPLEGTRGEPVLQNFVANQIVDLIERLFETEQSTGPMMRNHVRHALLLAMCHPEGGTLADAARVFEDTNFRNWLMSRADKRLADYFKTFAATNGDQGYTNWLPYLIARLNPFVQNPILRRMLSRSSTLNLGERMDRGAILLFRLSKSVLQDREVELLGTLLLLQFHIAAMARAQRPATQRRPFHLFVDEFHTFANDSTPALFREARKFGLGLTVATQSLSSLRRRHGGGDLVNAVLSNTASKVFFRLSPLDAQTVSEYSEPTFGTRDLIRTPNYQAVVCMSADDAPPFMLHAALPRQPAEPVALQELREASGRRYGTPLAEADAYLARRHGAAASGGGAPPTGQAGA